LFDRSRFEGVMIRNRYYPKFAVCDFGEDKQTATTFWILRSSFTYVEVMHSVPRQDCVNVFAFLGMASSWQNNALCIDQIGKMRAKVLALSNSLQKRSEAWPYSFEVRRCNPPQP